MKLEITDKQLELLKIGCRNTYYDMEQFIFNEADISLDDDLAKTFKDWKDAKNQLQTLALLLEKTGQ